MSFVLEDVEKPGITMNSPNIFRRTRPHTGSAHRKKQMRFRLGNLFDDSVR